MKAVIDVDYIEGHLRTGYYKCTVPEEEKNDFLAMSVQEKCKYIKEHGEIIISSYEIDEVGDLLPSTLKYES